MRKEKVGSDMLVVVSGGEKATDKKMFWRRRQRDKNSPKYPYASEPPATPACQHLAKSTAKRKNISKFPKPAEIAFSSIQATI
jgi:hypothetical protein